MAVGKLNVSPVTLRGIRSGFVDARFFIGCFVQPGEKHRTHALEGLEPRWTNQLTCNVSEGDQFLNLELVNESPNNGGIVASGKVALKNVFNNGSETTWTPLQTASGEAFGELQLKLSFDGSSTINSVTSSFGDMNVSGQNISYASTTSQSYTTSHGHSDSRQSSFSSLGPANPIPQNYGIGAPPPFTPPAGGAAASYSAGNNTMPGSNVKVESQTISTENMTKEEFEEQKARGNIPSWVKYGGGALGAAAAVGLAAWGAHELKEHYEKKEEEEKSKYKHDSKPFTPPSGHFQQQSSNQPYAIENHGQKKDSYNQPHYSDHKEQKDQHKKERKEKKEKRRDERKEKRKDRKHGKGHGSDSSSSDSSSDSD